jgi:predicted O-methyltransferase YrrM
MNDQYISNIIKIAKKYIDTELVPVIKGTGEYLEGNIFMEHLTTNYTEKYENKQKNIVKLAMDPNIDHVLEIGFNSGFSALLMLISNPSLHITCIDLGEHKYAQLCYEKLKKTFGERINLIIGNSVKILPSLNKKYDFIHIDGGHDSFTCLNDTINSYHLSKNNTILLMDDYELPEITKIWDFYIDAYNLQGVNTTLCVTPYHRANRVVKINDNVL